MHKIHLKDAENLPVVKTSSEIHQINDFVGDGYRAVVRIREPNAELYQFRMVLQNKESGKIAKVPSRTMFVQYGDELFYPESEWTLVHEGVEYVRPHTEDWAAYLVPPEVKPGERVYVRDVIEDIYVTTFWDLIYYATNGEAIWTGTDLSLIMTHYEGVVLIG